MITDAQMKIASRNLTHFVITHAERLKRDYTGFGYIEAANAPATFEDLKAAYDYSMANMTPLPVWSGGSEDTIYSSKEGNWAFRFWHDVTHCAYGLSFSLEDEVKVSMHQARAIELNFGRQSLEYRMFIADTVGQSLYTTMHKGAFPADQWAYVRELLNAEQRVPERVAA